MPCAPAPSQLYVRRLDELPGSGSRLAASSNKTSPFRPLANRGVALRYLAAFAAAGLGAATIAGAIWAWQSFMAQGAQPAEALPANALAYAASDLDPPGGQKVAAYDALRKFPSLKRELGLGSVDDLHKSSRGPLSSDSGCDLGYAAIKPWLGDRIAVAVVAQKKPEAFSCSRWRTRTARAPD